jgi:hypothetical protein
MCFPTFAAPGCLEELYTSSVRSVVCDRVNRRADHVLPLDLTVDCELALGVRLGMVDQIHAILPKTIQTDGGAGLRLTGGAVDDRAGDGRHDGGGNK